MNFPGIKKNKIRMIQLKSNKFLFKLIKLMYISFLSALPSNAQLLKKDLWKVIVTDTSNYTPAYLGNGMVGLRSQRDGLGASRLILNGLYDRSASGDYVRLINNFNPMSVKVLFKDNKELLFGKNIRNWKQIMDLKNAGLETSYSYANQLKVNTHLVALRNLPMAAMCVYEFEAIEDIEFIIQNTISVPNYNNKFALTGIDLRYNKYSLSTSTKEKIPVMFAKFPTESGSDAVSGANTFYFNGHTPQLTYNTLNATTENLSFTVSLKKGEKFSFSMLSAFTHTGLTSDLDDAVRICSKDYNLGYKHLLENHKTAWGKLWESDIEIDGDDEVQIDVRLALYSLYSSIATGFDLSIPPCGLAETAWGGHIFWDSELWMYPSLLVMKNEMARSMINFRSNTLSQAKNRAAQFGYSGAMYPWESDLGGNECTPISYKLDMNEHHITADIAIAAWNYYRVTKNEVWLREKGFSIIKECANFWVSRTTKDREGKYHINNVVGPDEYHEDINDDAFTNGAVKMVLGAAIKSAKIVKEESNAQWKTISENIVILNDPAGHTLQYDGYKGDMIKQADVNLLSYPLDVINDKEQIVADLKYYEPKIDPNGPSMSYSALATSYARLGQTEKAYQLFKKAYQPNQKAPFNFISEKPHKSATVFCTGYGGILQTVIFGFGGMRIGERGLYQDKANLPTHWKKMTIKISGQKDIVCD